MSKGSKSGDDTGIKLEVKILENIWLISHMHIAENQSWYILYVQEFRFIFHEMKIDILHILYSFLLIQYFLEKYSLPC